MKTESRSDTRPVRVEEIAPAKVNLFLSVGGKREDGYHEIVSLMETVSLCDKLTVQIEKNVLPEIKLSVSGKYYVPKDPSNLVIRAAETFFATIGKRFSLSVSLQKNIPTEAGLGGGSADAAAMLRALNRLAGNPLTPEDLRRLAVSLGADVAFCLFGGTAVCTGIGDRIQPIADPARRFYTVLMGADRVSTPAAYRALDEERSRNNNAGKLSATSELAALSRGANVPLLNDFESAVFPAHPGIAELKARLLSLGASDALMSGSGAAVFGLFPDAASAVRAASAVSDADAFAVRTVGRYYP